MKCPKCGKQMNSGWQGWYCPDCDVRKKIF